jgi:hypothetical protein
MIIQDFFCCLINLLNKRKISNESLYLPYYQGLIYWTNTRHFPLISSTVALLSINSTPPNPLAAIWKKPPYLLL